MEFIPKYLAQKFYFFKSVSMLKFSLLFFGLFFITLFLLMQLEEYAVNILSLVYASLIIILFAAFLSVRYFSRKPWVPTSPLIVQFTSKAWFNSVISLLSIIRHWGVLIFVNVAVVIVLYYKYCCSYPHLVVSQKDTKRLACAPSSLILAKH